MDISLIICTKDRYNSIKTVLACANEQTFSKDRYQVLIFDQSENDLTHNAVEEFLTNNNFKYFQIAPNGLANSRNVSLQNAEGKILVYVDDDVEFGKEYLENIYNFFQNSTFKPDFCGGKTLLKYLDKKPEWIDGVLLGILAYSDYGNNPLEYDSHPKHTPYGCNMAIKKEVAISAGGFPSVVYDFNPSLTENEDVLMGNTLRQKGFKLVYNPEMIVYHRIPQERLTYDYYKKRFFSQGQSDAFIYHIIGLYQHKDIYSKALTSIKRIIESIPQRFLQKNLTQQYYQKLRLHYNRGFLLSLVKLLKQK